MGAVAPAKTRSRRSSAPVAAPKKAAQRATAVAHDHDARIRVARQSALTDDELRQLSDVFGALAEPTRLRILHMLSGGEACVYDLARALDMSASAISHQLRGLRALRLVRDRREGREKYYAVDDRHVVQVMSGLLTHLRHGG